MGHGRRVQGHARIVRDGALSDALLEGHASDRSRQQRVRSQGVLRLPRRSVHARVRQRVVLRRQLVVSVVHEAVASGSVSRDAAFALDAAEGREARDCRSYRAREGLLPASRPVPRRRQPDPLSDRTVARRVHRRRLEPSRIGGPRDRQGACGRLVRRLQRARRLRGRSLPEESYRQGL